MNNFWQSVTVVFAKSVSSRVLFVVCLAFVLAFLFEAPTDAIFPIFTLGFLAAIAEYVMHDRNNP
jgi:hypothetical protein